MRGPFRWGQGYTCPPWPTEVWTLEGPDSLPSNQTLSSAHLTGLDPADHPLPPSSQVDDFRPLHSLAKAGGLASLGGARSSYPGWMSLQATLLDGINGFDVRG